jgi:hypothetical protein
VGSRRYGTVEGVILGRADNKLVLQAERGVVTVPTDDITEVDHPGNVLAAIGGALAAYGVLNIAAGWEECQNRREDQGAFCFGVVLPFSLGTVMTAWGLFNWFSSKKAYEADYAGDLPRPPSAERKIHYSKPPPITPSKPVETSTAAPGSEPRIKDNTPSLVQELAAGFASGEITSEEIIRRFSALSHEEQDSFVEEWKRSVKPEGEGLKLYLRMRSIQAER